MNRFTLELFPIIMMLIYREKKAAMSKKNICILYGGRSGEHEVSMTSAASIAGNLNTEKYILTMIWIDKSGRWYLQPEASGALKDNGTLTGTADQQNRVMLSPGEGLFSSGGKIETDFVFPVLHGSFGEDGTVQGLLELMDLPYAGSGVLGSSLGMDKALVKRVWAEAGLDTVPFIETNSEEMSLHSHSGDDLMKRAEKEFGFPLFIKPVRAGSSVGISRVDSPSEFRRAVELAFRFDSRIMIEPAVDAREIECSVTGNLDAEAFPPGEIIPSHDFYDYEAKYIDENGAALSIPADISTETAERVREAAVKAYLSAGIEGMARVDFFIDRSSGKLLLNEINTIPGFTKISMFPKLCGNGGLPYGELLDRLIELGFRRFEEKKRISFSLTD